MALSIVAQAPEVCISTNGVERETTCRYDVFTGTAEALCAAGLISPDQLHAQAGRQPGHTTFLPSGETCPSTNRAWREPGYKSIRQQPDGTYRVEVTVSKDVYSWRRSLEKAQEHEVEQERIDQEIAEHGAKYRDWVFRQSFDGWAEEWKGTKTQLQAAGLGVGIAFPGEPGSTTALKCKCPLGFDFVIESCTYNRLEKAAGIFTAYSRYVPRERYRARFGRYVAGVAKQEWDGENYGAGRDCYKGTAEALVAAGLVPNVGLFPGQAGGNKMRATFRNGWRRATSSANQDWVATIVKGGRAGEFILEVPAEPEEVKRRKELHDARERGRVEEEKRLSEERRVLRQGVAAVENKTVEMFRSERANLAEVYLRLAWSEIFAKPDGALRFDVPEDSKPWVALAEAFQTIRDVARDAPVLLDEKKVNEAKGRIKLASARNDTALQSLLRSVGHLRLVDPAGGDK